jgi:hypothetical protein
MAAASLQGKIRSPSNVAEMSGGAVDDGADHRWVVAPACWKAMAAQALCPSVRRRSAGGRGAEEEEDGMG